MSDQFDQFKASIGGKIIDVSGMSNQEILDLYVQRKAAIANGEDPDDPEVAARYKP